MSYDFGPPEFLDARKIKNALRNDPFCIIRMDLFAEWEIDLVREYLEPAERVRVYFTWLFGDTPNVVVGVCVLP